MTATTPAANVPATTDTVHVETARLADQLERSLRGGAWHGPALLPSVDGLDAVAATAHPVAGAHSIHEIVWHAAFWLDVAHQRITGAPAAALTAEADWPAPGGDAGELWQQALARLEEAHRRLHAAVLALPDERLDEPVTGSDPSVRGLLLGVLQHSAYHAGQLVLLRRALAGGAR